MNFFPYKINFALVVSLVAVGLDILFHITLTNPMESFDYFAVKCLIAFFVTTIFMNWPVLESGKIINFFSGFWVLIPASIFTFLMSLYYRWWELLSGVPYGVRPPDITFIDRDNTFLFALSWFIGHSIFYLVGVWIAKRTARPTTGTTPALN
ncbi:MAG: hypothetical protein AAB513_00630 [Patescibacteria group bacterium]